MSAIAVAIRGHVDGFFRGHIVRERRWLLGPMADEHPDFYVCEIAPGPRSALWLYVSVGTAQLRQSPLEFILACPVQTERGVELVTMAARYHKTHGLGVGHTVPIGDPWLPGGTCDHFLVSVPYPWGPGLETVDHHDVHAHPLAAADHCRGASLRKPEWP